MRKLFYTLVLMVAVACGPSRYAIPVEMRYPSKSGLELGGKNITVAYSCVGNKSSDSFSETMVEEFAKTLEDDYNYGGIVRYKVDGTKGDYAQRDSLVKILMSTGADFVILFASPQFQNSDSSGALPLNLRVFCYDGMNKEDKVFTFAGNTVVTSLNSSEAKETGKNVADTFRSQWKQEQYSIAYYDNARWYDALVCAEQYDWKGAMDIWIELLNTGDMMKRAAAEYNISVACYMLGDYELAEAWLKKSKADNDMPTLTDAMSKRIKSRM